MTESKQICGADLLRNPQLNRADAFTQEERDARGLRGLLPPAVSTMELQVKRTLALLDRCPTALDKFLMLDSLRSARSSAISTAIRAAPSSRSTTRAASAKSLKTARTRKSTSSS